MELKHFRLIKTIAEEGNIANSSEKLFLTQSALSHQLRELEERLGFKVFHRSRNNWSLTEEGIELHQLANTIFDSIAKGFNNIKHINEGAKGVVRLSTECYSFYQGLPGFIQQMGLLYPNIEVQLMLDATHQTISKIIAKEIDIAIVSKKPAVEDLSSVPVFEDEIFALIHSENPLVTEEFLTPEAFENVHLVIHSFPLETVSVYEHFLKPNKIMPKKITAIPLTEVALEIVIANMGIMCMPKWALKSFKVSEGIVLKKLGKNGLKRNHYLVYRNQDQSKKYIKDFIESFKDDFSGK